VRLLFLNLNKSVVFGGIERWMLDTAEGLAARGYESVLSGRPDVAWLEVAKRRGLRVRADARGTWARRVLRVREAMMEERPDVVIVKGKKLGRMAAWARATGAPGRVAMMFGLTHELDPKRWIDRFTWRGCDAGIVLAHGAARWYDDAGFGPLEKLHVLWKGVDLPRFDVAPADAAAVRAEIGVGPQTLVVGTVGRLAWQKGLDRLFTAIGLLRDRLPQAKFVVVGGGGDAAIVEKAAAELGDRVKLLGPREDVPRVLAAFDIAVLPSRFEVMSQTTLESMAAGRAIVSTRTMGADEAIEDGVSGVLVPVDDPAALADAIASRGIRGERRAALGAAARRRVEAHFTLPRMLDGCERIFAAVAADRPAQLSFARET
jgi:glycosyltransferase involved in cell wall biosynthesis